MAKLIIGESAQRELEEIAQLHLNLSGPNSARKIADLILDMLSRLEMSPLSGHIPQDKQLRGNGYRYVIAGKYICVYRVMVENVFVYHIAHGASNYPTLFKNRLKKSIKNEERVLHHPPFVSVGPVGRLFAAPLGEKAIIKAHADQQGESVNAFLLRAAHETMARDQDKS